MKSLVLHETKMRTNLFFLRLTGGNDDLFRSACYKRFVFKLTINIGIILWKHGRV
jgi:hypothetical protein